MANTVECPACSHSWPATEADLGLRKCPACGADLEITSWSYEAAEVTVVKEHEPHPFKHEDTD